MLLLFIFEEVKDPLVLHQPGDEVERRLAILHAIVARSVISLETETEVRKPVKREYGLDDLGNRLLLKDPAVGGSRQEPKPGDNLDPITPHPPRVSSLQGEATDHAMKIAGAFVEARHLPTHGRSHEIARSDRVLFRKEVEFEREELRDRLAPRKSRKKQNVLSQSRLNGQEAGLLINIRHDGRPRACVGLSNNKNLRQTRDDRTTTIKNPFNFLSWRYSLRLTRLQARAVNLAIDRLAGELVDQRPRATAGRHGPSLNSQWKGSLSLRPSQFL